MSGIFVLVRSVWADWADHPYYQEEDVQFTLDRGYFTSQGEAQDWIEAQVQRELDSERDTWRNTQGADQARHATTNNRRRRKQQEYDAIVAAGLEPSFERPSLAGPWYGKSFDEEKARLRIRRRENYEIVELKAHS